jgi:hypothetical protein
MSERFIVKHYTDDPHPTLKGNGFDGLVIGDYREEAEKFITFVNHKLDRIEELEAQLADLSKLELKLRLSDRNNYYVGVRQDIAADMREIIHREKGDE